MLDAAPHTELFCCRYHLKHVPSNAQLYNTNIMYNPNSQVLSITVNALLLRSDQQAIAANDANLRRCNQRSYGTHTTSNSAPGPYHPANDAII